MASTKRAVTLKDVARLAGISTGIASMALADNPRVAAKTKESVREAAQKLGYTPNVFGRALRSKRIGAIAMVIPHSGQHVFSHPYFAQVLIGVTEIANAHKLTLLLSTSHDEEDEEDAYLKILESRRADGIIVAAAAMTDPNVDRLIASEYPVVLLESRSNDPRVVSVFADSLGGAERITAHLLEEHNLTRIAHITGPLRHRTASDKLEGYRTALGRHGISFDEDLVITGDYSQESGQSACVRLIESGINFDGIFAANDEMAFGALQALQAHGLDVPGDIALVGFDDISLAQIVRPAFTTVNQPAIEVGKVATRQLIDLMGATPIEERQIQLPTQIMIRNSCGCQVSSTPGRGPGHIA